MPSLLTYRRDAQAELGPLIVNATTTTASDSVSFTCSALVNANAASSQFKGAWVYLNAANGANLSAGRKVASTAGYDPDTGSMTVARAFSTAVVSSVGFEISTKLPAVTDDMGIKGIREIINETLISMPPIDLLPMKGVTAQEAYDVTTVYPWITERAHILGIYFQDTNDEVPKPIGVRWGWQYDVEKPRLVIPSERFITGETFYVKARRPAQDWVRSGNTWAADSEGLQDDTDEALPLRKVMRAHVLSAAYRTLGAADGPAEYRDYYREREAFWLTVAMGLKWWSALTEEVDYVPRPHMVFSSSPFGSARSYR